MSVKPIPDGYHTVTPYLIIKGAAEAIEFYKRVFDATELFRVPGPNGALMHAEIKIGDSIIMLADEFPQMDALGPKSIGGSPVGLMQYLPNVVRRGDLIKAVEAAGYGVLDLSNAKAPEDAERAARPCPPRLGRTHGLAGVWVRTCAG